MQKVLTAAEMREVDRQTTEKYGIPSIILMENAAHAVTRVITEKLGSSVKGKSILILCGKGNNGGDGAALARCLWALGAKIHVLLAGKVDETSGDARVNFDILEQFVYVDNFEFRQIVSDDEMFEWWRYARDERRFDAIVDAVFGTGLNRPIEDRNEKFLDLSRDYVIDKYGSLTVAIDLPSGLDADLAYPIGFFLETDLTISFSALKPAQVLAPVFRQCGEIVVASIGSPKNLIEAAKSQLYLTEKQDCINWFWNSRFFDDSYKNKRGHALLIAGSESYSGAAVLAGNAAMRSGVGLVTLAAPKECKVEIASRLLPDVILKGIDTESDEQEFLTTPDAIAVGCGLSATDPAIEKLVRNIVTTREVPVIIDAGALWFYSPFEMKKPAQMPKPAREQGRSEPPNHALVDARASALIAPLILTPHEGEFLRLLGTDDKEAIKDRVAAVREFSQKHKVILVLKGERVLIGEPGGKVVVNPTGNSGLGKAGNGDTLTGILAGFVAQAVKMNIDILETVVAAVYIAGMAGDVAEKKYGKRVMTASDVRECLTDVFAEFEQN